MVSLLGDEAILNFRSLPAPGSIHDAHRMDYAAQISILYTYSGQWPLRPLARSHVPPFPRQSGYLAKWLDRSALVQVQWQYAWTQRQMGEGA